MNKFTFTNKEEYLAYRSNWKAEYKALSQTIREKKWLKKRYSQLVNQAQKEVGENGTIKYFNYIDTLIKEDKEFVEIREKNKKVYLDNLKRTATLMLAELKDAKVEANRQYLASKNILTAIV